MQLFHMVRAIQRFISNYFFSRTIDFHDVCSAKTITYGTISSFSPLIKRIGTVVICGITSLLGQY